MAFADDERDLEQTASVLKAWLSPKLSVSVEDVCIEDLDSPLSTGFSSDTVLFDLVYPKHGREIREGLVARLEPEEYVMFPYYDVQLQAKVLQLLEKTDVPVPIVRWCESDKSVLGVPFYVMARVEGRIPTDNPPMHDEGWIAEETSEEERSAIWWNGFEAMCRIHRLSWKELGFGFLAEPKRGETLLDQQLDYWQEYFRWGMEASRHPDIARGLEYLESNKPVEQPVALCWGDSRLANQIFDGVQCVAVLDWEMARLGDPVQDLAWWLASDRCFSEGLELERLPGFPGKAESIARWEQSTDHSAANFDYYFILALTRFSMNMARVGQYMKQIEIIDEENEFDYENLASITLRHALSEI
ncbi:MAG: phosphotransferase family protein [Myxococcales bacterium]|nr:phosphotransferase family protein [Myxococcales bacterium]